MFETARLSGRGMLDRLRLGGCQAPAKLPTLVFGATGRAVWGGQGVKMFCPPPPKKEGDCRRGFVGVGVSMGGTLTPKKKSILRGSAF